MTTFVIRPTLATVSSLTTSSTQPPPTTTIVDQRPRSGCHPECRWACDDPVCTADCRPACSEPRCQIQCSTTPELGETFEWNADCTPTCRIQCPPDQCSSDACPQCEIVCDPPQCDGFTAGQCQPLCEAPVCAWDCTTPAAGQCQPPTCELVCERPACGCDAGTTCPEHTHPTRDPATPPYSGPVSLYAASSSSTEAACSKATRDALVATTVILGLVVLGCIGGGGWTMYRSRR